MPATTYSVIVPVFNKAWCLRTCLDSIVDAAAQVPGVELVFVDHCSTDGSSEILAGYNGVARVDRHVGGTVAEVRNVAARRTEGQVLCFLDCDCVVRPDYLLQVRAAFERTGAAAVGCEYSLPPDPHWIERAWHDLHFLPEDGPRRYLNAGNFAVLRSAFDAVGGFDAGLETGEDYDIGVRLNAAGHGVHEVRAIDAAHLGNPKSVGAFFGKQRWHGLGLVGADGRLQRNAATAMTLAHGVGLVVATALLVAAPWLPVTAWLPGALVAATGVPLVTALFRARRTGGWRAVPAGVFLYFVYYCARLAAIGEAYRRRARRRRAVASGALDAGRQTH